MGEFRFLQLEWLLLLPLLGAWLFYRGKLSRCWPSINPAPTISYPALADVAPKQDNNTGDSHRADQLIAIALLFTIFALTQPVIESDPESREDQFEAPNLVIVYGTAVSMNLKDYKVDGEVVDRMSMSKRLLDRFIQDYSADRYALVIMGESPTLWLPWTNDKALLRHSVSRIRTTLGGRLTNMSAALSLVAERLADNTQDYVVLMLTDGGIQIGTHSPQTGAAAIAASKGHLYTLAMGAPADGAYQQYLGELLYEPLNFELMRQVSRAGNGEVFHAVDQQAMQAALKIVKMRHQQVADDDNPFRKTLVLYPYLLVLSAAFFVLAVLLHVNVLPFRARQ